LKLIKTTFFSAIVTFIRIASGFVASKVVAIFTGPSGVALIGAFSNFITIALTFANGAINTGVVKYTAEFADNNVKLKQLFSTAFKISVGCSFIIGFFLFLLSSYFSGWIFSSDMYAGAIRVLGVTIIFYSINTLFISILNGKGQIRRYTIVNTVGSIVSLLFTVILVYFFKLNGAFYALVLAQSIVFFVTAALIIKSEWFDWTYFNKSFNTDIARRLAGFSLMAVVTALTGPVSQILLRNLLIHNLGINSAGYWQGVIRVSDGYLLIITTSLSTYYLPKLSSLINEYDIRREIFNALKIIVPAVLFGCICTYELRFFIIRILYTKDFLKMEPLFFWQLLGDFFKMGAWVIGYLMIAKAMTKLYIITDVVFNLVYVGLGYFLVDVLGLRGVTVAFAITYFIYLLFIVFIFRRILFSRLITPN
jgi:O-antigen/teichoic acid export membrane protein